MFPSSKVVAVLSGVLVACVLQSFALANTSHHHIGGGSSSGGDTDADCLRWGFLTTDGGTDADAADSPDANADAGVDAGGPDGGSGRLPGMVCLERAALFNCDIATAGSAATWPSVVAAAAAILAFGMSRRRGGRRQKRAR